MQVLEAIRKYVMAFNGVYKDFKRRHRVKCISMYLMSQLFLHTYLVPAHYEVCYVVLKQKLYNFFIQIKRF